MAGPGDLQGALSAARFEAVASVLDAQELQVRSWGETRAHDFGWG